MASFWKACKQWQCQRTSSAGRRRRGWRGRTSMSSRKGRSASGCGRVPLTATACLFAGGAASSGPPGRLRSSILTVSSDGGATVLAWRLISADNSDRFVGDGEERRRRRSGHGVDNERVMRERQRGGVGVQRVDCRVSRQGGEGARIKKSVQITLRLR
jgi:hypothetical protein